MRKMSLAILFPHPLDGSLGSFRRAKEVALGLSSKVGVNVNIYTPYENQAGVLTSADSSRSRVAVKPVRGFFSVFGLSGFVYNLSKRIYYNPLFSKKLLIRSIGLSTSLLFGKLCKLLSEDGVKAIQAEQDVTLPLALKLGGKLNVPVIADLHNISAEELVASGVLKRSDDVYVELQNRMREWLSNVGFICVVSQEMKHYVATEYGVSNSRILVVPPGGKLRCERTHENPHARKVAYTGTISYREHVDLYVQSINLIREKAPDVEFYATGKGEDLNKIKALCQNLKAHVNWFWFPDESDFFRFLCSCSVGVLPSSDDKARIMGTPIKLFDYLSAGLPIVANDVGGWSAIIEQENVGILTEDTPESFSSALLKLACDESLRKKMSRNAIEAVRDRHSWDRAVEPLVKAYETFF